MSLSRQIVLYSGLCFVAVYADLRLLVIGGETVARRINAKIILPNVEILDPFNPDLDCTKPPDLPFPRKCFVSEYLDQKPMIIGGRSAGVVYDTSLVLVNNTWIDAPIRLNHSRYCAISAQPEPKMIWVLGGDDRGVYTGMTAESLQHFSLSMGNSSTKIRFNDTANAPVDSRYSTNDRKCVAKINSTHLFLVGYNNNASYIVDASKEPYTFRRLPQMKYGSHIGGACAAINDSLGVTRLFVVGGGYVQRHKINLDLMRKTEFFDFVRNKWMEGPILPRIFYMGASVTYPDERGFVLIGGQDLINFERRPRYFSDLIRYNQSLNKFEYLPKHLNIARSRFGAMLVETIDSNCTIYSKITISCANAMLPENWKRIMFWYTTIYAISYLMKN